MPSALVIGGSGFVGTVLARVLRERNWNVTATSVTGRNDCSQLDISDRAAVKSAMTGHDAVFNLAARRGRGIDSLLEGTRVNVVGAVNVITAASEMDGDGPALIFVGSAEEYGATDDIPYREDTIAKPLSAYGATKLAATEIVLACTGSVSAVVLRPALVYGPGQPHEQLVTSVARAAIRSEMCLLNGGEQTRDLVYVDDLADALILAAEKARGAARGMVINIGSGTELRVRDVADMIIARVGSGSLAIGPDSDRLGDTKRIVLDASRAHQILGWKPKTSLETGIARTVEVMKRQLA